MKLADIRRVVAAQQLRLGLSEWTINARWGTKSDIAEGAFFADCDATTSWQIEHKHAKMLFNKTLSSALEEVVVHELLHLRLEGHKDSAAKYDSHYEYGLNVLSKLLVEEKSIVSPIQS